MTKDKVEAWLLLRTGKNMTEIYYEYMQNKDLFSWEECEVIKAYGKNNRMDMAKFLENKISIIME